MIEKYHSLLLQHQSRQSALVNLAGRAVEAFLAIGAEHLAQNTQKLKDRLATNRFKVLVLGEFKRGKSTFINALLGNDVLPAFVTPCTAVINEVKWGERRRALVHFRNPVPNPLPATLPTEVLDHVSRRGGHPVPPMEISVDQLDNFVAIPDPSMDQEDAVAESPYSLVELMWPLEFCREGVEIIDSPGLNEHQARTAGTTGYLSEADAVIFVMSCHSLASQSEMSVIDRDVLGSGHEEIFFICNRFDEVRDREKARLVEYARKKLSVKTKFGEGGVYFLSAFQALNARITNDPHGIEESGLAKFETALRNFLANDRGRIKLSQPSRELLNALRTACEEIIPNRLGMLGSDLHVLEERYEKIKPELVRLEKRRSQITESLKRDAERLSRDVESRVRLYLRDIAGSLADWMSDVDPEATLKINVLSLESTKLQAQKLAKNLTKKLSEKIENDFARWRKEELQPLLDAGMERMTHGAEEQIQDLLSDLDAASSLLTGIGTQDEVGGIREVGAMERVLSAAGGFFIGGVGSAAIGAACGYQEMLKSIIPQIGLAVLAILAGVSSPIGLIAILLGGGALQAVFSGQQITTKLKDTIAKNLATSIREKAAESASSIAATVKAKLNAVVELVGRGLQAEIDSVRLQAESAMKDLSEGTQVIEAKKKHLSVINTEITDIRGEVDDIIYELIGLG